MWIPTVLTLDHFISHEHTTFQFAPRQNMLIFGRNFDNTGQPYNGSGKSTIADAMVFVTTGRPLREVPSVDHLIHNNHESCMVKLTFVSKIDGRVFEIVRTQSQKSSGSLSLSIDGNIVSCPTVRDGNNKIWEILGISKEDFLQYYIVTKDTHRPFMRASDGVKKQIIARFANAGFIDHINDGIKAEMDQKDSQIRALENKIFFNSGQIESLRNVIASSQELTEEQYRERQENHIAQYLHNIEMIRTKIDDKKKQEDDWTKEGILLKKQYERQLEEKPDFEEQATILGNEISELNTECGKLGAVYRQTQQFITKAQAMLDGAIECPKCQHRFVIGNNTDLKQLPDRIRKAELLKDATKVKMDNVDVAIKNKRQQIDIIENQSRTYAQQVASLERQMSALRNKIYSVRGEITSDEQSILSTQQLIEEIRSRKFIKDDVSSMEQQITQLIHSNKELEVGKSYLVEERKELAIHTERLKRFRTFIINNSIAQIEAFVNHHLQSIATDMSVRMEGYRYTKSGQLREKVTTSVMRGGVDRGIYGKFSGGERVRIDICTILALRTLINLTSPTGGIDLLFLDEIIESVDDVGAMELMNALNRINQTICTITHANYTETYRGPVCNIVKKDGYSHVEKNVQYESSTSN